MVMYTIRDFLAVRLDVNQLGNSSKIGPLHHPAINRQGPTHAESLGPRRWLLWGQAVWKRHEVKGPGGFRVDRYCFRILKLGDFGDGDASVHRWRTRIEHKVQVMTTVSNAWPATGSRSAEARISEPGPRPSAIRWPARSSSS